MRVQTLLPRLTVCSLLLMAAGCGQQQPSETATPAPAAPAMQQTVPALNVGHVGHDHQLALYVAALEGQLLENHCGAYLKMIKEREVYDLIEDGQKRARLHLFKVGGGSRMPASMERGEIDIGLGGVPAVAFFIDKGNDFKIVFPLQADGDMLVMRPDFPATDWTSFIAQVKASDQVLKIGYKAPLAVAKLIFERALEAEGIPKTTARGETAGKIEFVNLQGDANMAPSLLAGAVDGMVINQPHASTAVYKNAGKIVCDLSALPPEGKWEQHPCCCVAATENIITEHRGVVKAFLKALHAATDVINTDQQRAIRHAAAWIKSPMEVEQNSVASVTYVNVPTDKWRAGVATWAEMMADLGKFTGRLKDKDPNEVVDLVCDLSIIEEIAAER